LWVLAAKDGFFCLAMPTRSAKAGRQLLRDFDGALMADAYTVYKKLAEEAKQGGLALNDSQPWQPQFGWFVCWSHARRPFEQTAKSDGDADVILDLIAALYEVEARAKKLADGDDAKLIELRRSLRATESTDIIEKIRRWRMTRVALPGTKLADGLGFLKNQWSELTGFLTNPLVPLDNNLAERAIRTPVLGRKNHLGSHSARGAHVSALFYSLLGSCRLVGVSPTLYLTTLVDRCLRDRSYIMLPHVFAAELAATASAVEAGAD
jgi:transposase